MFLFACMCGPLSPVVSRRACGPKNVDGAHSADTDHRGEGMARPRVLTWAGLTAQLTYEFAHLPDSSGANRVAHCKKAA